MVITCVMCFFLIFNLDCGWKQENKLSSDEENKYILIWFRILYMHVLYLPFSYPLLSNPPLSSKSLFYTNFHGPWTWEWGHMIWVSHLRISSQKISYFLHVNKLFFCVNSIYCNRTPSEENLEVYYSITMLINHWESV